MLLWLMKYKNLLKMLVEMLNLFSAGALFILFYFYSFKEKTMNKKIFGLSFLSFIFAVFFLYRYSQGIYTDSFLFSLASFIFLLFLISSYRDYSKNQEIYYLINILFYLTNFLLYYGLYNYPHLFVKITDGNYLTWSLFPLAGILIFLQFKESNKVDFFLFSFLCLPLILLMKEKFVLPLMAVFFLLNFIYVRQILYLPLLEKNKILEEKVRKREADLPEHLREKFQIMEHNKAKLMDMAYTDKMTGVYNKDKIVSQIRDTIKDKRVKNFSIIMFDIDNFKRINDNLGHLIGDEAIINMARIGEKAIRGQDSIGRYGGDEFIILLPNLNAIDAKVIAERLRKKIESDSQPHFTISLGVASYPDDGQSFKELLEAADQALYKSKERGKNRVSHLSLY